jgi:hypothetical protein
MSASRLSFCAIVVNLARLFAYLAAIGEGWGCLLETSAHNAAAPALP